MCKSLSSNILCRGCRVNAVTMTKNVPGISLLLQQRHKLFSARAQSLSTIHFTILPLRLGICSFSLQYFVMRCIRHTVSARIISLKHALFHTNWIEIQFCAQCCGFVFQFWHTDVHTDSYWGCPMSTNGCCVLRTHSLTDKVIITCTRPPLPSHWSRSPDSCPCSLPAPGHNQKSPYRRSHSSHLQSLLTPSGREILQNRHRWSNFIQLPEQSLKDESAAPACP